MNRYYMNPTLNRLKDEITLLERKEQQLQQLYGSSCKDMQTCRSMIAERKRSLHALYSRRAD